MIVQGDPTYPAVRALLGDYAVRQNQQDRSQPLLNEVMDRTFRPLHEEWKKLWLAQQEAERSLHEARAERDEALQAFRRVLQHVYRVLSFRQGEGSPLLQIFLPGGGLDVLYRPVAQLLRDLEPYAAAIGSAPGEVFPLALRASFAEKYLALRQIHALVERCSRDAITAQQARAALDDSWTDAFNVFHRAVEYVAFKDRGAARDWIRDWVVSASRPLISPHVAALNPSWGELHAF